MAKVYVERVVNYGFRGFDPQATRGQLVGCCSGRRNQNLRGKAVVEGLNAGNGSPTKIQLAESETAELLGVGSSGSGALHTLVFGSTALVLVKHACCAVVVIPSQVSDLSVETAVG